MAVPCDPASRAFSDPRPAVQPQWGVQRGKTSLRLPSADSPSAPHGDGSSGEGFAAESLSSHL